MGNYAIVIVLSALLVGSVMMMTAREGAVEANAPVEDHHFKTLAREASMTGLNWTVRRLVADTDSWTTNPDVYGTGPTPKEYRLANFKTQVLANYAAGTKVGNCVVDTVDVVSVGRATAGSEHRHELRATYVRTCADPGEKPLFYDYPIVSDFFFDVKDEARVFSGDQDGNANIHSNDKIMIRSAAYVEGYASQTSPLRQGSGCDKGCPSVLFPNDPSEGDQYFQRGEPEVDIPWFNASEWLPKATVFSGRDVSLEGKSVIDFTAESFPHRSLTGYGPSTIALPPDIGTAENPFIWYIDGDLLINASRDLELRGYSMIITTGGVKINASSNILTSVSGSAQRPPSTLYSDEKDGAWDDARQYIRDNLTGGTTFGIFAEGCFDGNCDSNPGIHIDGKATFTGQLFANHDLSINDDIMIYGSMATKGKMTLEAKSDLWYVGASDATSLSGSGIVQPEGIRLLSIVEW